MKPKYIKTAQKCVYTYVKDGETFWAYRYKKKENGKIKEKVIRFDSHNKPFVDYGDLMKAVNKFLKEKERESSSEKNTNKKRPVDSITLEELWESFKETNQSKADSTIIRYDKIFKNHIKDYVSAIDREQCYLAKMPVGDIPVGALIDFLTAKLDETYIPKKGASPQKYKKSYINAFRKLFVIILNYGKNYGFVSREKANELLELRFDDNKIKSEVEEKIRILTAEQIAQIEDLLKGTDMYLPFMVGLLAGARTGEAFAVRFSDFHSVGEGKEAKYYLDIKAQMVEVKRKFYLRQPKTFARTVPIPKKLYDIAMERKAYIDDCKEKDKLVSVQPGFSTPMVGNYVKLAGNVIPPHEEVIDDFISMAGDGRYLFYTGSFKKYANIIRRDYCPHIEGIEDFSFYTARKTYLSNMANSGIPPHLLADICGHKKINTLLEHYYSRNEDSEFIARDSLDKAMELMKLK